ncbi:uncharacterized protein PAC_13778 [Phialocephala subalpina]|uniref:DUF7730 domain-containing protein n=1 Tax=Phialocephala subalpina TaxID=576137 RepID=A0A1L7XFS1_9HELO|nr:uncharacterized protein PAC_13778 [Phialocephala subalpina]
MRRSPSLLPDLIPCIPNTIIAKLPTPVLAIYFIFTIPFYCILGVVYHTFQSCLEPWVKSRECKREKRRQEQETRNAIIKHTPSILGPRDGPGAGRPLTIGRPEEAVTVTEVASGTEMEVEAKVEVEDGAIGAPKSLWKRRTDEQSQCHLFKLPLEIRNQIWEELITGYTIHIFFVENYLPMGHSRCKPEGGRSCACQLEAKQWRAYQPRSLKQKGAVDAWGQCELLALPKTCRRIYSETIELLYHSNTFDFNSIVEVFRFSLTVLPDRIQVMKNVRWKYAGIYDSVNPRYVSVKRFGVYPRIGEGEEGRICNKRPWLVCRKSPEDEDIDQTACSCLSCWTPHVGIEVEEQQLVIYNWLMALVDMREREKILEREKKVSFDSSECPTSSGTLSEAEE